MASAAKKIKTEDLYVDGINVKQLQKVLLAERTLMSSQVKHEDVAIFIGTTKSGKSTLIDYLIGDPLVGVSYSKFKPVSIEKANEYSGPAIGSDSSVETTIPSRWDRATKLPGLTIYWTYLGSNIPIEEQKSYKI